jgi:hypothetical protein
VDVLSPFRARPDVSITVVSAVGRPWHNTVEWRVENGSTAPYLIERRFVGEPWKPMVHISAEGGRLVLQDHAAMPGALYGYRVRLGEAYDSERAGEVTLQTPK